MFKVGDVVYCIDNHFIYGVKTSSLLCWLEKDTPYTIHDIDGVNLLLTINKSKLLYSARFITEEQYIINSRKDKILYLKKIIKCQKKLHNKK